MKIIILISLSFLPGVMAAQRDTAWPRFNAQAFGQYETLKKDKGAAAFWSVVFPGGGQFYAGREGAGLGFMAIECGEVLLAINTDEPSPRASYAIALLVTKIIEAATAFDAIDDDNAGLRHKLLLSVNTTENGPLIGLRFGL